MNKGENTMRTVFSIKTLCLVTALFALTVSGMNAQAKTTIPVGLEYERNGQGGVTITGYTGRASALVIPATIEGLPVTTIGEGAFSLCTGLRSVTLSRRTRLEGSVFPRRMRLTYRD